MQIAYLVGFINPVLGQDEVSRSDGENRGFTLKTNKRRQAQACLLYVFRSVSRRYQQLIAPQQFITCPLTYADISQARKSATPATSSGVPARRSGIVFAHSARISSGIALVMSVAMKPGAIQFTLMPRGPISLAMDLEKPISPAFDAA